MANANNVDTRVVEMEFDNDEFQAGAKATLNTLNKLNSSLQFDKLEKSFNSLSRAAGNIDFSGLKNVGNAAQQGFSAMETIAYGAFQRIGYKVTDLGTKIANELLFAQKRAGFAEYELELGSVQTIQASSGKNFDEIYEYLGELNKYSDQTIYSFSDMTSSIGKFTNAGVDLDVAVKAIQGISNEAALSGANANEASRAMYNFAQALSSGSVKLMDWKSIELANMGTMDFKQQLIDTAVEMGTLVKQGNDYLSVEDAMAGKTDNAFNATMRFNDSLASAWMTSDVLVETLAKYSDETTDLGKRAFAAAQDVKSFSQMMDTLKEATGSGWSETFRLIFGEFEDAKKLWTGVSNALGGVIDAFSELRNHALRYWSQESGRTKMLDALSKLWRVLETRLRIISDVFQMIFPEINQTGHKLVELTNRFSEFADSIDKKFNNFFSIMKFRKACVESFTKIRIVLEILHAVADKVIATLLGKVVKSLITKMTALLAVVSSILIKIINDISELIDSFEEWIGNSENLKKIEIFISNIESAIKNLAYAFLNIYEVLKQVVKIGIEAFTEVFSAPNGSAVLDLSEGILTFSKSLKITEERAKTIKSVFKVVFKIFKLFGMVIGGVVKGISALLKSTGKEGTPVFSKFANKVEEVIGKFISFLAKTNLIEKAIKGIGSVFNSINQFVIGLTGKSILDNLLGILDFFGEMSNTVDFESLGKKFKNFGKSIVDGAQDIWTNVLHLGDENSGPAKLVEKFNELKASIEESGGGAKAFGEKIRESLEKTKRKVKENIDKIIGFFVKLKNTITFIADSIKETLKALGETMGTAIIKIMAPILGEEKVKEIKESETFFGDIWNHLEKISELNKNKAGLGSLGVNTLTSVLDAFNNGLKEAEWLIKLIVNSIFTIQAGIGILSFGSGVNKIGKGFRDITKGLRDLTGGVIKAGKMLARAKELEALSQLFISFAVVLLSFFAIIMGITALFTFGGPDAIQAFTISVLIMVGFITILWIALGSLIKQLNKLTKDNGDLTDAMEALSKMLISMAVVMGTFAIAVAILAVVYDKLGTEGFVTVVLSLVGILSLIFLYLAALISLLGKNSNIITGMADMALLVEAIGRAIRAMGFAMIEMAAAMLIISIIPEDDFERAAKTMLGMLIAMMALIFEIGMLAPKSVGSNFDYLADIMENLGGTLFKMAMAMAILSFMAKDEESFIRAGNAMGLMLLAIGGLVAVIGLVSAKASVGSLEKFGDLVSKLGVTMLLASVSLAIIGKVLESMQDANLDPKYANMLLKLIVVMGLVLAGLGALTMAIPGGGATFIAIAAAFVLLSLAVGALGLALSVFQELDIDKIAKGFKKLGKTGGWIIATAGAFLLLGVGCAVLSVGLLPLVGALGLLWPIIERFIALWPKISEMLGGATDGAVDASKSTKAVASLGEVFGNALMKVIDVVREKAPGIIEVVADIASLLVQALLAPLRGLGQGLIQVLIDVLTFTSDHLDEVLTPLGNIITKLYTFITLYAPLLASLIGSVLIYVFLSAVALIDTFAEDIANGLFEAFASVLEALAALFNDENNERVAKAIADLVDGIFKLIKKTFEELGNTEMAEAGANLIDKIVEGFKGAGNKIKKAFNDALGFDIFKIEEEEEPADIEQYYTDGVYDPDKFAKAHGISTEGAVEKGSEDGEATAEKYQEGFEGGMEINSPSKIAETWGGYIADGLNIGFVGKKDEILAAIDSVFEGYDFTKAGTDIGKGIGTATVDYYENKDSKDDKDDKKDKKKEDKEEKKKEKSLPSMSDIIGKVTGSGAIPSTDDIMANTLSADQVTAYTDQLKGNMANSSVEMPVTPVLDESTDVDNLSYTATADTSNIEKELGSTSTLMAQETNATVSAGIDEETKTLFTSLKQAVEDLNSILDNIMIVSDDATLQVDANIDGETAATAIMPFVDAFMEQSSTSAKAKKAQSTPAKKSKKK